MLGTVAFKGPSLWNHSAPVVLVVLYLGLVHLYNNSWPANLVWVVYQPDGADVSIALEPLNNI